MFLNNYYNNMQRINTFFITIIQVLLLNGSTKQSKIKQTITAFKAMGKSIQNPFIKKIGNTIKNSMSMFHQKKNTIKKFALSIEKQGVKYLRTSQKVGSKSIKHLGDIGQIQKYKIPNMSRGTKQLFKESKQLIRKSVPQTGVKELKSLVNLASKSMPYLPFLFITGGLMRTPKFNLKEEPDWEKLSETEQFKKDLDILAKEWKEEEEAQEKITGKKKEEWTEEDIRNLAPASSEPPPLDDDEQQMTYEEYCETPEGKSFQEQEKAGEFCPTETEDYKKWEQENIHPEDTSRCLSQERFEKLRAHKDVVVLDTRNVKEYLRGHIPNALFVPYEEPHIVKGLSKFQEWVKYIISPEKRIIIVTNEHDDHDVGVIVQLNMIGYGTNVLGYLDRGQKNWFKNFPEERDKLYTPKELEDEKILNNPADKKNKIQDVRKQIEWEDEDGVFNNANLQELKDIRKVVNTVEGKSINKTGFKKDDPIYFFCGGGQRSVIAMSWFRLNGFTNVKNILGGKKMTVEQEIKLHRADVPMQKVHIEEI